MTDVTELTDLSDLSEILNPETRTHFAIMGAYQDVVANEFGVDVARQAEPHCEGLYGIDRDVKMAGAGFFAGIALGQFKGMSDALAPHPN